MRRDAARVQTQRIAVLVGAFVVIGIILWIDIATGIWQELVILSGLAAGLVTFLLTALVLSRVMEKSAARRWAPVNRLALSEFLHALADEEGSEISRGRVHPRSIPTLVDASTPAELSAQLHVLREVVVDERRRLSEALSRWAEFLASSGDNEEILRHVAAIALRLDRVRDAALELEESPQPQNKEPLVREIDGCNTKFSALVDELQERLRFDPQVSEST
ncbi:hypothetical protein ACSS7Z_10530 [Microbacterium sp. A82]|uniref:hypothetical protein n=1 Tax=unclassified Microbacterium TaxID=2609290 RepID=UPI003F3214BD